MCVIHASRLIVVLTQCFMGIKVSVCVCVCVHKACIKTIVVLKQC